MCKRSTNAQPATDGNQTGHPPFRGRWDRGTIRYFIEQMSKRFGQPVSNIIRLIPAGKSVRKTRFAILRLWESLKRLAGKRFWCCEKPNSARREEKRQAHALRVLKTVSRPDVKPIPSTMGDPYQHEEVLARAKKTQATNLAIELQIKSGGGDVHFDKQVDKLPLRSVEEATRLDTISGRLGPITASHEKEMLSDGVNREIPKVTRKIRCGSQSVAHTRWPRGAPPKPPRSASVRGLIMGFFGREVSFYTMDPAYQYYLADLNAMSVSAMATEWEAHLGAHKLSCAASGRRVCDCFVWLM